MKKQLLALCCAVILLLEIAPAAHAKAEPALLAADMLATLGLVKGTGGESGYALSGSATRAQAITIIVRLSGCEAEAAATTVRTSFTDLPAWAGHTISYAYGRGWVAGTGAETFSPNKAVTANAYVTFLLRMLGYRDSEGDFAYSDAMQFAQRIGLIHQDYSNQPFTRGALFEITADALTFPYKDSEETVIERLLARSAVDRAAVNALGLLNQRLTARQIWDRKSAAVFGMEIYDDQMYIDAQIPSANASGFFISEDGLAVTNYHAIRDSIKAVVTLSNGEQYPVERVLYARADQDLAILRVSKASLEGKETSRFACLDLSSADTVYNGDTAYTISNPLGEGLIISSGIISCRERAVENYTVPCIVNTADISQGSSGGALLNAYGQVIGITTGAYVYGNSMYLAVPVDPVFEADLSGAGWTLEELSALENEDPAA